MKQWLSMALVIMALSANANAADKPNFSGEWKINPTKSEFGPAPLPEKFVRKIEHVEPSISIVEDQVNAGTPSTTTRKVTTDGKAQTFEMNGAQVKASAAWADTALIATTAVDSLGVTFKDRMSLSGDGKVLTSKVLIVSPQGEFEITVVFDRQ